LVAPELLQDSAIVAAKQLMQLPMDQYGFNKQEIRERTLEFMRKSMDAMF